MRDERSQERLHAGRTQLSTERAWRVLEWLDAIEHQQIVPVGNGFG